MSVFAMTAGGACLSAGIDLVVTRADGRVENLGTVSYWHRSFVKRAGYVARHLGVAPWSEGGDRRLSWRSALAMLLDRTGATVFTHAGKAIVTDRVKGAGGAEPLNIGWGTGAGTAAAGDTTLFTERDVDLSGTSGSRTAGTSSRQTTSQTNDTYRVVGTRTATGSGTVTNGGLFDNVTIASGTLLMKGDFTGVGLVSGDSIQFTFNLQFT